METLSHTQLIGSFYYLCPAFRFSHLQHENGGGGGGGGVSTVALTLGWEYFVSGLLNVRGLTTH